MLLPDFEKLVKKDPEARRLLWHTQHDGTSGYLAALTVSNVPAELGPPPKPSSWYSFFVASSLTAHSGAEISRVIVPDDKEKIVIHGVSADKHLTLRKGESGLYSIEALLGRFVITAEGKWNDATPPRSFEDVRELVPEVRTAPGFIMLQ